MKIIVAPDSFKGSISAKKACDAIERGIISVLPNAEVVKLPIADGGEGTVESFITATSCKTINVSVAGPLGLTTNAEFAVLDDNTAIIEMAMASGLTLIPEEKRNPMQTTSYGTGELIKAALDQGCRKLIVGLGGSATNDGGMGLAQALGYSFKDSDGRELGFGGGEIDELYTIDCSNRDKRLDDCEVIAACDVKNILCGKEGASYVFGPQKGATQESVKILDDNLKHYAEIIKKDINLDICEVPGAGAAGGLGAGLVAFCNASIVSGIDTVLDAIGFDDYMESADLVITGEGKIDVQSFYGKVPIGVAKRAKAYQVPVIAIGGTIDDSIDNIYEHGITAAFSIVDKPMTLECAISNTEELLTCAADRIFRLINIYLSK